MDKADDSWMVHPGSDVRYQMRLEYLAELGKFMQQKYNWEIVWKDDEE